MRVLSLDACSSIHPTLAARLALAAVHHVLYARGQVPYPVSQLSTILTRPSKITSAYTRAVNKRDELIDALDALEAQLASAIQRLSWTLGSTSLPVAEGTSSIYRPPITSVPPTTAVHIMILVGTSLNTPKGRFILEINGFEALPFGWRNDDALAWLASDEQTEDNSDYSDDETDVDELASRLVSASLENDDTSSEDDNDEVLEEEDNEKDMHSSVLGGSYTGNHTKVEGVTQTENLTGFGRCADPVEGLEIDEDHDLLSIPSPEGMASSSASQSAFGPSISATSPSEIISNGRDASLYIARRSVQSNASPQPPIHLGAGNESETVPIPSVSVPELPKPIFRQGELPPESYISTAVRSLHRTLAGINMATPFHSLSSPNPFPSSSLGQQYVVDDEEDEIPLSQTCVLLRAPRRFLPLDEGAGGGAWVPRQTYVRELDDVLRERLSPCSNSASSTKNMRTGVQRRRGPSTRVLRVVPSVYPSSPYVAPPETQTRVEGERSSDSSNRGEQEAGTEEENEMIWWQWNGKLKGIGDDVFSQNWTR